MTWGGVDGFRQKVGPGCPVLQKFVDMGEMRYPTL